MGGVDLIEQSSAVNRVQRTPPPRTVRESDDQSISDQRDSVWLIPTGARRIADTLVNSRKKAREQQRALSRERWASRRFGNREATSWARLADPRRPELQAAGLPVRLGQGIPTG